MGVPILSLCGVRPASRNSAAILARVGLTDWAVATREEYLAFGVRLANELDRIAEIRSGLPLALVGSRPNACSAKFGMPS